MPVAGNRIDPSALIDELRAGRATAWIGVLLLASVIAYITVVFAGDVNPVALGFWSGAFVLVLLVWCSAMAMAMRRDPGEQELFRVWIPVFKGVALAANLLIAASVWLFLPVAGPERFTLLLVMYVWFIPIQMIAENRATRVSGSATFMVFGSLTLFVLTHPAPYSTALAAFLVVFTVSVLAMRRVIHRALAEAIVAKLEAERAGRALNAALTEVADQRDAITRFLAAASHDLQQPVQAARLFFDQAIDTRGAEARDRAIRGARRAFASTQSLLQEMLEHLRLESGAARPALDDHDLGPILRDIALDHEAVAEESGVAIRVAPTRLAARVDPNLARRILGNLVTNACGHAGATRLLIGVRRQGARARIYVIDNGGGVDPAKADTLFGEFAAPGAGRANFGLGLSASRRFARAMGGDLTLDPRWTAGAAFVLDLCAGQAGAGPADAAAGKDRALPCEAA